MWLKKKTQITCNFLSYQSYNFPFGQTIVTDSATRDILNVQRALKLSSPTLNGRRGQLSHGCTRRQSVVHDKLLFWATHTNWFLWSSAKHHSSMSQTRILESSRLPVVPNRDLQGRNRFALEERRVACWPLIPSSSTKLERHSVRRYHFSASLHFISFALTSANPTVHTKANVQVRILKFEWLEDDN